MGNWVENRDASDVRVIGHVINNYHPEGWLYNAVGGGYGVAHQDDVGGYPVLAPGTPCADTDSDGMPDEWETANGLNPNDPSDRNTLHSSGYTMFERYLNGYTASPGPLPAPWQSADIGTTGIAGSAGHTSGTFTVSGAGADIWGTNDAFRFVSQSLTGDGEIIARVTSLSNTHEFAKAGVMIRESLNPTSRHAMAAITPANGIRYLRRLTAGGTSSSTPGASVQAPVWLKVSRTGTVFTTSHSMNGTTWTTLGSDTIPMANTVYVGLAVTSRDTTALNTSVFDSVTVRSFSSTPCNTVTPSTWNSIPGGNAGYGAPFDVFAGNAPLVDAKCNSADSHIITATIGKENDTTRIAYTKGYYYDLGINNWSQFTGTCTGLINGDWCAGTVSATITDPDISTASITNPAYFVGMTCSVQGGGWKCGCRDTSCANFLWQIQGAGL